MVKGCKTDSKGTVVQGNHKSYRMSAASPDERLYWIQCIQNSIREYKFHDIINAKKAALKAKHGIHNSSHSQTPRASATASVKSLPATPKPKQVLTPKRPLAQSAAAGVTAVAAATPPVSKPHNRLLFRGALTSTPIAKKAEKENHEESLISVIGDKLI